jgi:predicted DNA binding protein
MWVMKLKLDSSKQFLGSFAIKHQVSMTGYPLSYYKENGKLFIINAGFIFGEEKNKKALIRDIKKRKELIELEIVEDFVVMIMETPLFTEPVYSPKIIRPSPVVINKDGYHIWDLASFDRKILTQVLAFAEKYLGAKSLKFKEEKISNISFTHLLPELTKNQKKALELAINKGYYDYPKKIKMEKLAKLMGISYSTFQAHLKKAEGKILPEVYKEL